MALNLSSALVVTPETTYEKARLLASNWTEGNRWDLIVQDRNRREHARLLRATWVTVDAASFAVVATGEDGTVWEISKLGGCGGCGGGFKTYPTET